MRFNPLNTELNPICHLLALLGAHPILHVSGIRVKHVQHCISGAREQKVTSLDALSQITEGSTIIDSVNRNECVALQTGVTGRSVVVSNVLMCVQF